jgi:ABC-2 type transport system permease protein
MSHPATLTWFAHHEFRLAWRDWLAMLTAGKPRRARIVAIAMIALAIFMHFVAFSIVAKFADIGLETGADRGSFVIITGCALLAWSLMMSQAMESVTRAFYARADLDLILSSPVAARRAFAVRLATMACSTILMAVLIAAPFINVLVWRGGVRWLAAYGVVVAIGAIAAAMAVVLTSGLFRTIGPQRTRLAAQIVAAVIGAIFVIGLQIAAIMSYGTMIPMTFLQSDTITSLLPAFDSVFWWPARAILGDLAALAVILATGAVLLFATVVAFSARFGDYAIAAAGAAQGGGQQRRRRLAFRRHSPKGTLRRKEWTLLKRDPWLLSQTLMQLLYLLPPALMLWKAFGRSHEDLVLLVPVLVMAAGQLAGGLAWLAISGEDAPDLVATAPIPANFVIQAKIEAVCGSVALIFAPLILAMALASPRDGLFAALFVGIAALSATLIQLWFRTQAQRKHFRRRQTSSRIATFAEAFSSIAWAATAGLAAAGRWLPAAITALIACGILFFVQTVSPKRD